MSKTVSYMNKSTATYSSRNPKKYQFKVTRTTPTAKRFTE